MTDTAAPRPRSRFARVRSWYARFEGPFSSISLVSGFVFDAVTLTRVDQFWENFWVIAHLFIVTTCMILVNIKENEGGAEANPDKLHFWLVNIIQFFFGGILSTYLVFYFRSGTIWTSWPFLLILAAAFIANERLKRHYARLTFQISLLFLSFYAFAIYLVPVVMHDIGPTEFIIAGAVSLVLIAIFLSILGSLAREKFKKSGIAIFFVIIAICAGMNVLYFFNLIPPIPLSVKDSGIYHSLVVNAPGRYTVTEEPQSPFAFFALSEDVHIMQGDPLFAYSAVFSPASFSTDIVHEWQFYDDTSRTWVTRARITLSTIGGRDGGYRTYSELGGITAGTWRVNIETSRGEVIGRMNFNVSIDYSEPFLDPVVIN